MAESPASWGAIPVAESPSDWGAVPVGQKPTPDSTFIPDGQLNRQQAITRAAHLLNQGEITQQQYDDYIHQFPEEEAPIKDDPTAWFGHSRLDDGRIVPRFGPDLSKTEIGAAIKSFISGVPGAGGGVVGMAGVAPLANKLRGIPRVGPLLAGATTIGGGLVGAIGTGFAKEKIAPTSIEDQLLFQENPKSALAGNVASQALFFRPGLGLDLLNRAASAGIGGGVQGASEVINAPEGELIGEGGFGRTAEAAAIGALLNKPTKLSEMILGGGSVVRAAQNKANSSRIIDSLSKASSKNSLPETTAAATEIALGGNKPLEIFNQIDATTGKSAMESASIFPESTIPIKSASESARVLDVAPPVKELVPDVDTSTTLGKLVGQNVEYAGETGKLIRDNEGNFLIVRDVQGPNKAPFIEIADTGKDPAMVASEVGVKSTLAKSVANYPEANPQRSVSTSAPGPKAKGRLVPIGEPAAVKTPVVEQMPVKPTETASTQPVVDRKAYLDELLATKEITKAEYNEQIKGVSGGKMGSQSGAIINPSEAFKPAIDAIKKKVYSANEALMERMAKVESAKDVEAIINPESVPDDPVLDNPNPNYQWKPFLSRVPIIGKAAKQMLGIVDENIGAISPRIMGGVRSRQFDLSAKRTKWNDDTLPFGQQLRKSVTPEEFSALDLAIQNGEHDAVKEAIGTLDNGKELIAAFEKAKASLGEQLYESNVVGRGVGEITNYWPRKVHNYDGLRAELSLPEQGLLDKAIATKTKDVGRALSDQEKADVLNQAVNLSLRGKPGFLKPRTIEKIQKDWLQFYEPFDVSMEDHINRVSRDVVNRKYLGKAEFSAEEPIGGDLGQIINAELASNPSFKGKNGSEAQRVVMDNLTSHLREETGADGAFAQLGNAMGRATNFLHLGDLSSAIAQFGDIFNYINAYGVKNTVNGYVKQPVKIEDVGIHEGHAETADYSRSTNNSKSRRFVNSVVETTVGWADKFNKDGGSNAARNNFIEAIKDPKSSDFIHFNDKWSQRFPERWPEIVNDLKSPEFSKGELNDNTRFFLFNELADLQPIGMAQRAQLENASPGARMLYSLKRYWVKQLNVIRAQSYEKMKNPATFAEGAKNLGAYAAIVGGGSAITVGILKDLLFGREVDEDAVADYSLAGLAQLGGVSKYNIHQARQDGLPTALTSFAFPLAADMKDAGLDLGLAYRSLRGDPGTPDDIGEFFKEARVTKNIPYLGRFIYNRWGRGAAQEEKRQMEKLKGRGQPNTLEEIELLLSPPAKKN